MHSQQRLLHLEELELRDAPSALGPGPESHKIHGTIEGHLTILTATRGSTEGSIRSGLLRGTTHLDAVFTDAQGDYLGTLVITTKHGTLTLQDEGNLNQATGQFSDHLTVTGGTGRFAGATGELFDQGTLNL